jgi:tetratricopeptide (TPR) repeat protein
VSRRGTLRDLAWLLPLAAVVRGIYLWQLQATPLGRHLIVDEAGYDRWALAVAGGRLLGEHPFYQAPLYPYALGAWYALFGHSLLAVRLVQAAGGLASVMLLYVVALRTFGRTAARVAALGAALYAPFLFYEGSILKESWAILLTNLLLLLLLQAADGARGRWLAAGVTLGLLALLRENALLYLPVLLAWNLARRAGREGGWRQRFRECGLLTAGMVAALLPAIGHNWAAGGGLLLTTYQGGSNFYIGNHPGAPGVYTPMRKGRETPRFEGADARAEAERRAGHPLSPAEVSRFWVRESLRFAVHEPLAFLALQGRKFALVWNAREVPDTWDIRFLEKLVPVLRLPLVRFGWIAPLGLLGMGLRPLRRDTILLLLITATTVASVVAFYVFARYRLPLAPLVLLFAGHAVARGLELLRARQWRRLALGAALLIPLTAFVHLPLSWLSLAFTDEVGHQNLGFLLLEDGDPRGAEEQFRTAVAINPDLGNAWLQLALVRQRLGDAAGAQGALEGLVRHAEARRAAGDEVFDPAQEAMAHREMGKQARQQGRREDAAREFGRAAALLPRQTADLVNMGIELRSLGRTSEAAAAYAEALRRDPDDPLVMLNLANVRLDQGRLDDAREILSRAAATCGSRRPDLCPTVADRIAALP